ncbi:MAG: cobalamin biosynthesis protein [Alphaproteobacteria bacterium]
MFEQIWANGASPALVLLAAMLAETLWPLPPLSARRSLHPLALVGRLSAELERRLDRARRGEATLILRGAGLLILIVGLAGLAGWAIQLWTRTNPLGWIVEAALVALLLDQRGTIARAGRVVRAMPARKEAAAAFTAYFGRAPAGVRLASADRHAIARATIEASALAFAAGAVGAVLWYAVLGLPGLFVHRVAGAMSAAVRSREGAGFGLAIHRFEAAFTAIPARLAVPILALAALAVPGASASRAVAESIADHGKISGLNDGWPIGAVAGALGLALGGGKSWAGSGTAKAGAGDINRARYLLFASALVLAAPIAAVAAYLV